MMESFPRKHKEVLDRAIRDQVRQYVVLLEKCYTGGSPEIISQGGVDNFQLEGEMNMSRTSACNFLIERGYSEEEAKAYLNEIPKRSVDRKIFVDGERWDNDPIYRRYKQEEYEEALRKLMIEVK